MRNLTLQRIAAIDVFRALTMFLMLFVNDIPGLKNIPHWLKHAEMNEDMLGFSDTIFPAFLFCMGMSISFAIQNRLKKGDNLLQVALHIFWRSVALITMGLFSVNYGSIDSIASGISRNSFCILMVIGFFLIWAAYPRVENWKRYLFLAMKGVGIALLLYLFFIFQGKNGAPFAPKWWGILGIIGWTYVVCSAVYLFTRESIMKNAIAWLIFIVTMTLGYAGVLDLSFVPGGITHIVFGFSGVLVSLLMQQYANPDKPAKFILILCGLGVIMLLAALLSHPHWIISKIQATPTWFFYCMAAFFPLFGGIYWLTDIKKKATWFDLIKPAGTATLTCYMIPYIWYSVYAPIAFQSGGMGLLRSAIFSLLIVGITDLLVRGNIKLKV